jgi:nuclear transport factor 2 (NTF2) superfamily protein
MTAQAARKEESRNPRTSEEARAFVARVESLFMPWNIDALVAGFTEDCIVRFGVIPEFRGREALRKFFDARRAKQKGYRLKKQFRALMDDVMSNVWEGEWEDADTGRLMKGFGVEVWTMQGGRIAVWEASFNAAPADQEIDVNQALR